ncbi:lipopolysaccharide biosynthesis protein [uncultured Bacteroides sp.]|uniref:lipopolysaccharide biosynthesis protein n=1 Tax=uncultured Bacteroides sp. TaxID=162156 RepID=UPI002AAB9C3E|nr:lipopolysaccharide biosynthesis protein [uncultured Bacteroides sp.]
MNAVKQRAKNGVIWSAFERFSVQGVQFVISVILARLLSPSDFGVVALVLVVLNILQTVNESGFGASLMQKLDRDELDFSSVFVLNIILGLFLYGILYVSAPGISLFFKLPQLTHLTRIIGLNLIITSFVVVQRTKLLIEVDFKTLAKASFVSAVISGCIGIFCAYRGLGVMSLVLQALASNGLNTLLIWCFVKWRPKLQFSYIRFVGLFNFAYKLILARLIDNVFQEVYSVVIGKVYSPVQLGYFNRAKSFEQLSSNNLTNIVQRVSVPILCESQKDKQRMERVLTKFVASTALIVYPLLFGLAILAKPLISVLLTDKWMPAAWMLQILCPVGFFYVISAFNRNVFNATGRTDWALKSEMIRKISSVAIIIAAIYWGFTALICSQLLIAITEFFVDIHYTRKQIGVTLFQQLKSVSNVFAASLAMAVIIWITTSFIDTYLVKLLVGFFVGALSYFSICYLFNIEDVRIYVNKIFNR